MTFKDFELVFCEGVGMESRLCDFLKCSLTLIIFLSGTTRAFDTVATNAPPVVRYTNGNLGSSSLVVDSGGNRYFTGYTPSGSVDFNLGVGEDTKINPFQTGFVTRINADGTYGWTQVLTGNSSMGCALLL